MMEPLLISTSTTDGRQSLDLTIGSIDKGVEIRNCQIVFDDF